MGFLNKTMPAAFMVAVGKEIETLGVANCKHKWPCLQTEGVFYSVTALMCIFRSIATHTPKMRAGLPFVMHFLLKFPLCRVGM
jgi:hypothetical protein